MNQPQLPAFLQNRQSKSLAGNLSANLGMGSPPYISIMSNRFTLIDATGAEEPVQTYDPKIGPYLDCIIIDNGEHISKVFYNKPFDPNANQYEPPACFSDNGVGPSRSAALPQAPTCAACPNNIWGSKTSIVSGKGIKACSDFQKLAILIPGDDVIFLLRIPPNSLTNLRGYNQKFIGQNVDVSDVITRMWFEPQQIGLINFHAMAFIDEASFRKREEVISAHGTDVLVGRTDLPRVPALSHVPQQEQPQLPNPQQYAPQQPQQQPQSFVPAAAPTGGAPQGAPLQAPQGGGATTAPATRQRRQRKTAAAPPQNAAPQGQPQSAPFRPETAPPHPGQGGTQPAFGFQPPAAPNADVTQALNGLFGPPGG